MKWGRHLVSLLMDATASGGRGITRHLIGEDNYTRLNAVVPAGTYSLDSIDRDDMAGRAASISRNLGPEVIAKFRDHTAAPFVPVPLPEQGA
jgi:hypothetical protein